MLSIKKLEIILSRIDSVLTTVAAISLFSIMIIIVSDVVMRYMFNAPYSWSYELIAMYLMTSLFFFCLSETLAKNGHIAVDILHIKISPRLRHFALAIGYWLSGPLFGVMAWVAADNTWISFKHDEFTSGEIPWPVWASLICVPLGMIPLLVRILLRAVGHTLSAIKGNELIDLPPISVHESD
ncbi:TRAP transporter small permease [Alcaligenaceae bacterium CGII-47]|nr:TRAP transporter small permease [Alcaligenaceae bacterium CGII-47]